MGYSITQAIPGDDQEELRSLINRNFNKTDSQWFHWSHNQNPFGENYSWLAREDTAGQLIGSTGLLTRRMHYAGKSLAVGQAESINIDKEHRSAQAAIKLQRALISHLPETDLNFVYGMTNTAAPVFKRCRYKEAGTFQAWTKPIRCEYKLKEKIRSTILRKSVSALLDLVMRAYSRETRTFLSHRNRFNFEAPFDDRFEKLYREHSNGLLMVERTRDFLEWRFCQEPTTRFHIMTMENYERELQGYMVYVLGETGRTGDYAAGIQDFFYRDSTCFKQMLAAFCRHCRQIGLDSIVLNYFGQNEVSKILPKFGFFKRDSTTKVFVHENPHSNDFDSATLLDSNRWHLTNAELLS